MGRGLCKPTLETMHGGTCLLYMKYQQIGIPPEEAQFLETRKFQLDEIARLYRIPPHMIGDLEKSSFNNIEQQSMEFVKYTLDPWVIRWEQAMQKALFLPEEKKQYFLKFNVNGLLRGDYESRMTGYSIGRQNGWLSANEIREMEDKMKQIFRGIGTRRDWISAVTHRFRVGICEGRKTLDKDRLFTALALYLSADESEAVIQAGYKTGEPYDRLYVSPVNKSI